MTSRPWRERAAAWAGWECTEDVARGWRRGRRARHPPPSSPSPVSLRRGPPRPRPHDRKSLARPPIAAPGRSVRHLCERRGGAESRRARAMAPPGPHPYLQSSCLPVCCSFAVFLQFRGSTTCFAPPNPEALMTRSPRTRLNFLLVAALAFVASSVASAQGIESPRVPLRTAINEINALRAQYAEGFNKKDAPALTAMYLPDAVVIRRDGS